MIKSSNQHNLHDAKLACENCITIIHKRSTKTSGQSVLQKLAESDLVLHKYLLCSQPNASGINLWPETTLSHLTRTKSALPLMVLRSDLLAKLTMLVLNRRTDDNRIFNFTHSLFYFRSNQFLRIGGSINKKAPE